MAIEEGDFIPHRYFSYNINTIPCYRQTAIVDLTVGGELCEALRT